jgi:hypothetical protein
MRKDNLLMIANVLHILSVTRWEVESLVSERRFFANRMFNVFVKHEHPLLMMN